MEEPRKPKIPLNDDFETEQTKNSTSSLVNDGGILKWWKS